MNPVVILLIDVVLSIVVAAIGESRKFGFWGYFFASVLLTPVIGLLLVIASDAPASKKVKQ